MKSKLLVSRYTLPYKIKEVQKEMITSYLPKGYIPIVDIDHYHDCVKITLYGVESND